MLTAGGAYLPPVSSVPVCSFPLGAGQPARLAGVVRKLLPTTFAPPPPWRHRVGLQSGSRPPKAFSTMFKEAQFGCASVKARYQ